MLFYLKSGPTNFIHCLLFFGAEARQFSISTVIKWHSHSHAAAKPLTMLQHAGNKANSRRGTSDFSRLLNGGGIGWEQSGLSFME